MQFRHLLFLCLIPAISQLYAQESKEDLSKQAANPIAELISLPFQNNLNGGYGEYNLNVNILNIQPVIPLAKGKLPLNLQTQIYYNVVRPDFGPK